MTELEQQIQEILERNARVEADKAWESSRFRLIIIATMTYVIASLLMFIVNIPKFWLNAFVPTLGFILSVQSLPLIKKWWIANVYKR